MTQTYQKTFWKNEKNIEVPVALEDWPKWAKFLTMDRDGRILYWEKKPVFDEILNWNDSSVHLAMLGESSGSIGVSNDIWERPD